MIIWSGFGILIPVIAAICVGLPLCAVESLKSNTMNGIVGAIGFIATGLIIRYLSKLRLMDNRHSLFFIPWNIWAYIAWGLAGISMVGAFGG